LRHAERRAGDERDIRILGALQAANGLTGKAWKWWLYHPERRAIILAVYGRACLAFSGIDHLRLVPDLGAARFTLADETPPELTRELRQDLREVPPRIIRIEAQTGTHWIVCMDVCFHGGDINGDAE
jgi:hypothetical protein